MMSEGRVLRSYSGYYYVSCEGKLYTCKVRGAMKKNRFSLCTGDLVRFETEGDGDKGMITEVLPRKNHLVRPTVANLDLLVLTMALVNPDFSPLILDKLLVLAEHAGVPVLIVLTKADLAEEGMAEALKKRYEAVGYPVCIVSARTGLGIEELKERLSGKITALGGPSGVGKSTTLNAVQPGVLRHTGEVSAKIGRGRHTTRYAELVPFNGGYLADTPGFGNVSMETVPEEDLASCFPEFAAYADSCRFHPCSHTHEPSCEVKAALDRGEIDSERYLSYTTILQEIKEEKARNNYR